MASREFMLAQRGLGVTGALRLRLCFSDFGHDWRAQSVDRTSLARSIRQR